MKIFFGKYLGRRRGGGLRKSKFSKMAAIMGFFLRLPQCFLFLNLYVINYLWTVGLADLTSSVRSRNSGIFSDYDDRWLTRIQ